LLDSARRKFQHTPRAETDTPHLPRSDVLPHTQDAIVAIEADDVYGESHSEGMDARGRLNEEAALRCKAAHSQQTD
jgi:hypothetical protein